jgi:flagellar M-ring protein FliF
MEERASFTTTLRSLPLAHQVVIGIAVAVLGMAAFLFYQWISTPSYALLYSNLDDQSLATVVDELERLDVPYRIEGGGSRVLVPRSQVYEVRADLAASGAQSGMAPQGYEILDDQGLNVSDFRQRIDYQRALEGELARTLLVMDEITSATVHLVLPEESLFAEDEEPVTASVLIDTARTLSEAEVETITFLVASSVEGLQAKDVTVADVGGQVLQAAGQLNAGAALSSRNLRMTREFEAALAGDVRALLSSVVGANSASVVVRADLDFDERSTESETYDPDSSTALKEQTTTETFAGSGANAVGGTLGVDGSAGIPQGDGDYTYDRSEVIREYGVDRVISRTVTAPGAVKQLSVAVVMDDGSITGAAAPAVSEVESLVKAAIGLDEARGDTLAVSAVAFPAPEDTDAAATVEAPAPDPMAMIPQAIGGLVLLVVMVALLLMARGGKKRKKGEAVVVEGGEPAALPFGVSADRRADDRQPVAVGTGSGLQPEVIDLVQRQPEEVAMLLRGWLADRR